MNANDIVTVIYSGNGSQCYMKPIIRMTVDSTIYDILRKKHRGDIQI